MEGGYGQGGWLMGTYPNMGEGRTGSVDLHDSPLYKI